MLAMTRVLLFGITPARGFESEIVLEALSNYWAGITPARGFESFHALSSPSSSVGYYPREGV